MAFKNKAERMSAFVDELGAGEGTALHACYAGFFKCFNEQRYYEAHDVLEHLWLKGRDENYAYFKGLIQIAGAFVHLQKQFLRPEHPKDGRRLRPAARLFRLGMKNIDGYRPRHLQCDVDALYEMCEERVEKIVASDFQVNPWRPDRAPVISLEG
ncbi:MAG: DUF309 domain-containing protein [Verrucomicrobiota bacterium]|nr:DUF309 domain-containing protein [Verrucomicrobiota bacterium]